MNDKQNKEKLYSYLVWLYYITPCEFFIPVLTDGLSLDSE